MSLQRKGKGSARAQASLSTRLDLVKYKQAKTDLLIHSSPPSPFRASTSMRYTQTAAGTSSITYASLLNLLTVAKTTTTAAAVIESVKINKIHVWIPGVAGAGASGFTPPVCLISVRDSPAVGTGKELEYSLTAVSTKPEYWSYKPRGVAAAWFSYESVVRDVNDSSFVWCAIVSTNCQATVQLDFSYQVIATAGSSSAIGLATTIDANTAGAVLFPYLDSLADAITEGTALLAPRYNTSTVNMPSPGPKMASQGGMLTLGPVSCSSLSVCTCHH